MPTLYLTFKKYIRHPSIKSEKSLRTPALINWLPQPATVKTQTTHNKPLGLQSTLTFQATLSQNTANQSKFISLGEIKNSKLTNINLQCLKYDPVLTFFEALFTSHTYKKDSFMVCRSRSLGYNSGKTFQVGSTPYGQLT